MGDAPAKALKARKEKISDAPEVRVRSTTTADGYTLQALIPLSVLEIQPGAGEFLLQFQTSEAVPGSKERRHSTAFTPGGNALSSVDNRLFAHFVVGKE